MSDFRETLQHAGDAARSASSAPPAWAAIARMQRMRRVRQRVVVAALLVMVAGSGYRAWMRQQTVRQEMADAALMERVNENLARRAPRALGPLMGGAF